MLLKVSATAFLIVATPLFLTPANGQIGNPGFMAPGSADAPNAAPNMSNVSDRLFARLAATGGAGEVELSRLAQRKSRNDAVKAFAERMIADHGKSNARLAALAKQEGIALPRGMQPDQNDARAEMDKLDVPQFDTRYMEQQVADHAKTVVLLEYEINSGQNEDLQHFAAETLPTVLDHLEMAKSVLLQVRPTAPLAQDVGLPSSAPPASVRR